MILMVLDIETSPIVSSSLDTLLEDKVKTIRDENEKEAKKKWHRFLNPVFAKVLVIGIKYVNNDEIVDKIFYDADEKVLLSNFSNYLSNFKGLYVTYNGIDFDIPFLLARMAINGIQPPNNRFCNLVRFRNDPHYDVMQVLSCWKVWGIRLSEASEAFGINNPKDILEGKNVPEFLQTASIEEISDYVMRDVNSTYEIFKKLYPILS